MNHDERSEWELSQRFSYQADIVAWEALGDESGSPVLLLHGFPGNAYTWRRIAPRLAISHRVYVVDLLGFGRSSRSEDQDVSHPAQAKLVSALLEHWGLKDPSIVAHDIGAAYALGALLFESAKARRLILVDAATLNPCLSDNSMHVRRYLEAYETLPSALHATIMRSHISTTMYGPMDESTFEGYFNPWSDQVGQAAYYRFLAQFDEAYLDRIERNLTSQLEVPTLIIWGARYMDPCRARRAPRRADPGVADPPDRRCRTLRRRRCAARPRRGAEQLPR
jgi:pimeloyl-ACP methyl ester carboxylesterase